MHGDPPSTSASRSGSPAVAFFHQARWIATSCDETLQQWAWKAPVLVALLARLHELQLTVDALTSAGEGGVAPADWRAAGLEQLSRLAVEQATSPINLAKVLEQEIRRRCAEGRSWGHRDLAQLHHLARGVSVKGERAAMWLIEAALRRGDQDAGELLCHTLRSGFGKAAAQEAVRTGVVVDLQGWMGHRGVCRRRFVADLDTPNLLGTYPASVAMVAALAESGRPLAFEAAARLSDRDRAAAAAWLDSTAVRKGARKGARRSAHRQAESIRECSHPNLFEAQVATRQGDFDTAWAALSRARKLAINRPSPGRRRPAVVMGPDSACSSLYGQILQQQLVTWAEGLAADAPVAAEVLRLCPADGGVLFADERLLDPVVDTLEASQLSLQRFVRSLPASAGRPIADALWSVYLQRRAARLDVGAALRALRPEGPSSPAEALVAGALLGPASDVAPSGLNEPLLRAHFDEGVSLSPRARRAAGALTRASKASLSRLARRGDVSSMDHPEVRARLRCLQNLGGTAQTDTLRNLCDRLEPGAVLAAAVAALAKLDPSGAAARLTSTYLRVSDGGRHSKPLTRRIQDAGALEPRYLAEWRSLVAALRLDLGAANVDSWWDRFARGWWQHLQRPVPVEALKLVRAIHTASPERTLDAVLDKADLRRIAPDRLVGRLLRDPHTFRAALSTSEAPLGGPARWGTNKWRDELQKVQRVPRMRMDVVAELADGLRGASARARVRAFDTPVAGFERPVAVRAGKLALRLLDKRADAFAWLRLTDSVPCCLSSYSAYPRLRGRVYHLWRDPMSFAFQLERTGDRERQAEGFVFGAFGFRDARPIALLNGLYLRRQTLGLRSAVLAAIENAWARPLGLRSVAIASTHGGDGPLPSTYARENAQLTRLYGLGGAPNCYDDLRCAPNQTTEVGHLYWRHLA